MIKSFLHGESIHRVILWVINLFRKKKEPVPLPVIQETQLTNRLIVCFKCKKGGWNITLRKINIPGKNIKKLYICTQCLNDYKRRA